MDSFDYAALITLLIGILCGLLDFFTGYIFFQFVFFFFSAFPFFSRTASGPVRWAGYFYLSILGFFIPVWIANQLNWKILPVILAPGYFFLLIGLIALQSVFYRNLE